MAYRGLLSLLGLNLLVYLLLWHLLLLLVRKRTDRILSRIRRCIGCYLTLTRAFMQFAQLLGAIIIMILSSGTLVMHTSNAFLTRTPITVEAMRVCRFHGHPEVRS